ncbi:MAG: hypothetical protein GY694_16445 [Gammaproteobacteria bacterium]|nr:hypothetical protein [Gammaproteobacteria bacterium]
MNNHDDTPESIFSIPAEVDAIQRMDLIEHTMGRIKGSIMTINAAVLNDIEVGMPDNAISKCL